MPIIYAGKKLIPAPLVDIQQEFLKNDQGEILTSMFNITVNGTMVAYRGSPTSSGTFWTNSGYPADESIGQTSRLASVMNKQKAMEELFSTQGQLFEIQSWADGTPIFRCNPQILEINFPQGVWTEVCPYTITMQAPNLLGVTTPSGFVKNTSENWQLELAEEGETDSNPQSFRLTHTVNAVGLLVYKSDGTKLKEPWQLARDWVLPRLGLDSNIKMSSGVMNLPSYYTGYNHVCSESLDEQQGTYGITESWILASGSAIEDFTVTTRTNIEDGLTQVSINGTLTGLETRDSDYQIVSSKYLSASGRFDTIQNKIFQRAQSYSNTTLNPIAVTTDIGRNPVAGVINYTYEYDTRPTNFIPGARSEIITVVDNAANDVFAIIPVLGRQAGPVLQSINTFTETSRQLTIEVVIPPQSLGADENSVRLALANNPRLDGTYGPYINAIINGARPQASQVFQADKQESWVPNKGIYNYNITWVYQ